MTRLNILLVIATVLCALLLITSQHKARKLFNEFELEQEKTKQLDVEWGQLQLEQSTWATPSRVEKLARERLHMLAPDARRTVVAPLPATSGVAAGGAPRAQGNDASGERQ
jgi:cell division protein FtsL